VDTSSLLTAIYIIIINALLPYVMVLTTTTLELPLTTTDLQESMMLKLVVSRCLNTAVIKFMVTSYNHMFSRSNLGAVTVVLLADCLYPVVVVVDLPRLLRQKVFARFCGAKTQAGINGYFAPEVRDGG